MKPLLFVLLAASLVANVALLVSSRRSAPTAATVASPASTATAGASAPATPGPGQVRPSTATLRPGGPVATTGATSAAVPFAWPATRTDPDLHRVVAGLRAAGYPPAVVRAVINQLLNERYAERAPNAAQPFWKRGTPNPESAAAQAALGNERRTLFEELLGPDARPSAVLDVDAKERRYGSLADDKIDAIAKIERDYNEMSSEAYAKRRGNVLSSGDAIMQTQQLMEKEKLADLAAVLSPEELAQYEMRNSNSARQLMNNLRNLDVSESEYTRLYQAQKAFDEATPRRSVMDQTTMAQRQVAQTTLNEQARALLGDDRFYSYLEGSDFQYANIARTLGAAGPVTPAATYQVYKLQSELQTRMAQISRDGPPGPEKIEEMKTLTDSYHTQLVTLVGAPTAEAYVKQGLGRIFTAFRPSSRPTTSAVPATSLVPAGK